MIQNQWLRRCDTLKSAQSCEIDSNFPIFRVFWIYVQFYINCTQSIQYLHFYAIYFLCRFIQPFIVCLSICLSVYLSVCLFIYLSVCLSVCLSICLSVYFYQCYHIYLIQQQVHKHQGSNINTLTYVHTYRHTDRSSLTNHKT